MHLERYFDLLNAMRKRRTIPQLVKESGIPTPTVYRHIKEIEQSGLAIPIRPEGKKKRNTQWLLTKKGRDVVNAYF